MKNIKALIFIIIILAAASGLAGCTNLESGIDAANIVEHEEPATNEPDTSPSATEPEITAAEATTMPAVITTEAETTQPATTGLTGYHTYEYANGDVYRGFFADGVRWGQGKYTWANGIIYDGEWIDGEATGNGVYTFPPSQHDNEIIKSDFMQLMFDTAIDIPDSQDKIEPPPEGRSLELQYGAVPLSENIPNPSEYFKNIIFLGDSVTMGFDIWRERIKFNGEAVVRDVNVIAEGSYGVYRYLVAEEMANNTIHPFFNGERTAPDDIIAQMDAKYVFICLGLNDVGMLSVSNYILYYEYLINRIKEKSPEKTVVIMAVTPLVFEGQKESLNNEKVMNANNALLQFAIENNIPFIDSAAAIRDSHGCLYGDLSTDAYCHLTVSAYNRIVEYLLYHPIKD
jgi:hypothetical protein